MKVWHLMARLVICRDTVFQDLSNTTRLFASEPRSDRRQSHEAVDG
jgi:hypothetical protein